MAEILCDRRDGYAVLTMDRPARRNALGSGSMTDLAAVLETLAADPSCRAVVLTGAGPGFCAGSDLAELASLDGPGRVAHEAATAAVVRGLSAHPVPVIAAVEGYALGGGLVIATACDLVVSARMARWSMPEVPKGFFPPWGMAPLMARVGPVTAQLIAFGIEEMDGEDALRLGVADRLAADGQALVAACDRAERLAALPDGAMRAVKRFFGPEFAARAEALDARASGLFAKDCDGPDARATFEKFR